MLNEILLLFVSFSTRECAACCSSFIRSFFSLSFLGIVLQLVNQNQYTINKETKKYEKKELAANCCH